MEDLHCQYILHLNRKHLDENWGLAGSKTVSCNVCRRNFRSKQALWGHRRCCKAARAGNRNLVSRNSGTGVLGFKNDALESGWSATAKRGRKPVLEITSPECVAAGILVCMSSGQNGNVGSSHVDGGKRKAEMNESPPFSDSPMAQFGKDDMMAINSSHDEKEMKHSKGLTTGDHRCEVCGVCYPSGQALGGHKRKHWTGSSFVPGNRSYKASDEFPASVGTCRHWEGLWTDH